MAQSTKNTMYSSVVLGKVSSLFLDAGSMLLVADIETEKINMRGVFLNFLYILIQKHTNSCCFVTPLLLKAHSLRKEV